jgi:hypothetical protein
VSKQELKTGLCRQCGYSAEPDFIHNAETKHFNGHFLKCVRCGFQIETKQSWEAAVEEWNRRSPAPGATPAVEAINFALETTDGLEFLRYWAYGQYDEIRQQWPDAPKEILDER